jgi:hypothetical protein
MVGNLLGLTRSAYSPVGPWVELVDGGGRNNGNCIVTQVTRVTLSHNTSN